VIVSDNFFENIMPGRFQVAGCAIIEKEEKVLLTRRSQGRWLEGVWEFVSGRVEQGESVEQGLKREVMEEVNLKMQPVMPIHTVHFYRGRGHQKIEKPENAVQMITYICRYISGEVKLNTKEQDKFIWVDLTKTNLKNYPGLTKYYGEEIKRYLKLKGKGIYDSL
jgi:8-oxo-dGTP diphosphatase